MFQNSTLAFVGSGVMAEAMIKGILSQGLVTAPQITASDPLADRVNTLQEKYSIRSTTSNVEAVSKADIVVLSVKPQVLPKVMPDLVGRISPRALVLSIVAGARIGTISKGLSHAIVARAMPNTPAQIGAGMTVWTVSPETNAEQRENARAILAALGEQLFVEEEGYLDMATALSGTGPAYVFLFMEALIDAGVHMGFSRRVAEQLVAQTILGSVLFAKESGLHPAELRNMVTSPGGTSAEALYQMEKGRLRTVVARSVWAAYQRSRVLGGLDSEG